MKVLFLYADGNGAPLQHVVDNAPDDFNLTDHPFDLAALPDYNSGSTVFVVVCDDPDRPTVLDADSGDEIGATFGSL